MSNNHDRVRNVTLNFRVTPKEAELINDRIRASGLSKSTFFIQSCLYQKILIKGHIKTLTALRADIDELRNLIQHGKELTDEKSMKKWNMLESVYDAISRRINEPRQLTTKNIKEEQ